MQYLISPSNKPKIEDDRLRLALVYLLLGVIFHFIAYGDGSILLLSTWAIILCWPFVLLWVALKWIAIITLTFIAIVAIFELFDTWIYKDKN